MQPFITVDAIPTKALLSRRQPWIRQECPTATSSPTWTENAPGSTSITVPSWMLLRAPIVIELSSPRLVVDNVFAGPATNHLDNALSHCSIVPALVRPKSCGRVHLSGPGPNDPVDIDANILSDPADVKAATRGLRLCRELGNSTAFRELA